MEGEGYSPFSTFADDCSFCTLSIPLLMSDHSSDDDQPSQKVAHSLVKKQNDAANYTGTCMGPHDVLLGRTSQAYGSSGNQWFRLLISQSSEQYKNAQLRKQKAKITERIISSIKSRGGKFLELNEENDSFEVVSDKKCYQKVSHALRSSRRSTPESFRLAADIQHQHMSSQDHNVPAIPQGVFQDPWLLVGGPRKGSEDSDGQRFGQQHSTTDTPQMQGLPDLQLMQLLSLQQEYFHQKIGIETDSQEVGLIPRRPIPAMQAYLAPTLETLQGGMGQPHGPRVEHFNFGQGSTHQYRQPADAQPAQSTDHTYQDSKRVISSQHAPNASLASEDRDKKKAFCPPRPRSSS